MITENPETLPEEAPLIASAPAHVRLTQKQRQALIFLALAVPLWIVLSVLAITDRIVMFAFLAGLFLLVVIYGLRTEYLLFLWLATVEFNEVAKRLVNIHLLGVGIKGVFFVALLTQLPNKFSLMQRKLFRSVPIRWPLYLLLLWAAASIFWSDFRLYGLNRYLTWVMSFFLYAMVFLTINDRNRRMFFVVFAVLTGMSVLFGLMQRFGLSITFASEETGSRFFLSQWHTGGGEFIFRATGFAGQPNVFGRECVLNLCVLLMILISWRPKLIWRLVILGMLGIALAAIVLSLSRVAWGYFAVGAFGFLFFARRRWLVPFAIVAAVIVLLAWPQIWPRVEPLLEGTDASLATRAYGSQVYMECWKLQPITGFGFGSSGGGALFKTGIAPHEGYVFLLSSMGIIGLVLYLFVIFALLKSAIKVTRDRLVKADPELQTMAALGVALASVVALNFVVGVELSPHVWYLLGATLAAPRIARSRITQAAQNAVANDPDG